MLDRLLNQQTLQTRLFALKAQVGEWLVKRRYSGGPFGRFSFCEGAMAPYELNASTGGIELWVMLGLPMSEEERRQATAVLQDYQQPKNGLVYDPAWEGRYIGCDRETARETSFFFTMTAASALEALKTTYRYPIRYLTDLSPDELVSKTTLTNAVGGPYGIGNYGTLLRVNAKLGDHGAKDAFWKTCAYLETTQDPKTGFWSDAPISPPYTRYINLCFHLLRTTWNVVEKSYPHADKMIDICLSCADDPAFYGWENGFACNDLDLAVVLYSASRYTNHRADEVSAWAQRALPQLLRVQKADGGFSFYHNKTMTEHFFIRMTDGFTDRGDMWGTLMYMGAIKMAAHLAFRDVQVPWNFCRVHCVPQIIKDEKHV